MTDRKTPPDKALRWVATLAHDVGKYVARTARNLPDPITAPLGPELVAMLVRDLYALGQGERASVRFARLVEEAAPGGPPDRPGDVRLDEVRRLLAEVDALEPRGAGGRGGGGDASGGPGARGRTAPARDRAGREECIMKAMPQSPAPRRPKLLIVDDGDRYAELLHHFLRDYDYATRCTLPGPCWSCPERRGCTLTHAHDAAEVDQALARHPDVDVVLLDLAFELPAERLLPLPFGGDGGPSAPDPERRRRLQGLAILADLRRRRGSLPVVLMTSEEALLYEDAAAALAVDEYLTLAGADAFDARALGLLIERVLARRLVEVAEERYVFGKSAALGRLRRDAEVLARTSLPMLLLGETGSGKSALAEHVIHPASRRAGPFVSVDLAALPPTLVAAELFGTARGAYSGAVERPGRFERAHGGTLFLDEIGNVPLEVQRMLLLALEAGRVTRLGESAPRPVDVKLVAATNVDLQAAVRAGSFRADLHARLNPAAALRLAPLRERLEDLEALMQSFVRRAFTSGADRVLLGDYLAAAGLGDRSKARGEPVAELVFGRGVSPEASLLPQRGVTFVLGSSSLGALRAHRWPGNVRELERLVTSAAAFALADAVRAAEAGRSPAGAAARLIPIPPKLVRELLGPLGPLGPLGDGATSEGDGPIEVRIEPAATLHQLAQSLERQVFERLYRETGGDFAAMARRLLSGDNTAHARRVQLRFNQLGLRARPPSRSTPGKGAKPRRSDS